MTVLPIAQLLCWMWTENYLQKYWPEGLNISSQILSHLDQTGFILGVNTYNNVRRRLNLIQHGTQSKVKSLVISPLTKRRPSTGLSKLAYVIILLNGYRFYMAASVITMT